MADDKPPLSADNQIELYFNCGQCFKELPEGMSMAEFGHYHVGWTKRGLQVWCARHDINICNIDFEGAQHPAITSRKE